MVAVLLRLAVAIALLAATVHAGSGVQDRLHGLITSIETALHAPDHAPGSAKPTKSQRLGPVTRTAGCQLTDGLPDRTCTPGAIRSAVTLAMICRAGYSPSVRPPVSYTEPLKLRQMRAYGLRGRPSAYEEDHLVPISLGGAPRDPANLWPERRDGAGNAGQKDHVEAWAARMACRGRIPLAQLQREIARDWVALSARTAGRFGRRPGY